MSRRQSAADLPELTPAADPDRLPSGMTTTAEHLRNSLDGRWRDVKNQMRERLTDEIFRPHYTPNTVIARTKVAEQMSIMAAEGAADDGFRKEHGGNGNVGAAITMIEMLAMSDLSLMVKAGVQWGLFGGAVENLGTERHHEAYVKKIINLETARLFRDDRDRTRQRRPITRDDGDLRRRHRGVRDPLGDSERSQGLHRRRRRNRHHRSGIRATHHRRERRTGQPRGALRTGADPRRRGQRPARRHDIGLSVQRRSAGRRQRSHRVRPRPGSAGEPAEQVRRRGRPTAPTTHRSRTPTAGSSR